MDKAQKNILERALKREKLARKQAEQILEKKSLELYNTSQELKVVNEKLETLLTEKTNQLKGVFENISDAFLVIDLKGNVLKMNEPATHLLEHNINDNVLNVVDLIYRDDAKYAFNSFSELINNGIFNNYVARIITSKKNIKWVQINASIIYNKDQKPVAAQGIARDITEDKKLRKKLAKSNEELKEYAHIVSHDLKSPLRSIYALVSWLKEDNKDHLDESSINHFNLIENTLQKMEQLITDILSYSSLNNDIEIEESVNLNDVINNILNIIFIPKHIKINLFNKLPTIKGDKVKFQQLFQNLIGNAIKFIDKKEGIININVQDKKLYYLFSIQDNGIGIEEKYHKQIFKIFHSLKKDKKSSGIGLSIVKKIIDLYEGKIWLESELNKGTTFYFTLSKNVNS